MLIMVLNILPYGIRGFSITLKLGGSHPTFSSPEKQPEMMKSEGILKENIEFLRNEDMDFNSYIHNSLGLDSGAKRPELKSNYKLCDLGKSLHLSDPSIFSSVKCGYNTNIIRLLWHF